jgi:hypothetical protein
MAETRLRDKPVDDDVEHEPSEMKESAPQEESESSDSHPLALEKRKYPAPEKLNQRQLWFRFFKRLMMVMLRPNKFWAKLRNENIQVREIMYPHVITLIAIRAIAAFAGKMFDDSSFGEAATTFASSFVSWFALVWVFAIAIGSVATARGARINAQDPLRVSAYGLAPLFLAGTLAAVPLPYVAPIAELIAMPYAFYVLAVGVVPLLDVPVKRAPAIVGINCGLLLVLWAVMPTLVPLAVEALTR